MLPHNNPHDQARHCKPCIQSQHQYTLLSNPSSGVLNLNADHSGSIADFGDARGFDHANSHSNLIGEAGAGGFNNGDNGNIVGVVDAGLATKLEDNGGPTLTLRLLEASIARNAGNTSLALDSDGEVLTVDQRGQGFDRIKDGTVDIGAFES